MKHLLKSIADVVARELGVGHSEVVYQKAMSLMLQHQKVLHHSEYHLPISFQIPETSCSFHIGDERIDILIYDEHHHIHVVELKAVSTKITPSKVSPKSLLNSAHVQLLKYIHMLQRTVSEKIVNGYVINFRQSVSIHDPTSMDIEFDTYNTHTQTWEFGHTVQDSIEPTQNKDDIIHEHPNVLVLDTSL